MREGQQSKRNSIGGTVDLLTRAQLIDLFDPEIRPKIAGLFAMPGAEAVVVYRNLQMDSSMLGHTTAVVVGPGCSYGLEAALGSRLGDVPSRFQYPVAYANTQEVQ